MKKWWLVKYLSKVFFKNEKSKSKCSFMQHCTGGESLIISFAHPEEFAILRPHMIPLESTEHS